MGKITEENRRALESADNYEDAILTGMLDHEFTTELTKLIDQKEISTKTLMHVTGLSKSYINKLRNPHEKNVRPSRYVIINIALAIGATLDETNYLLKLAQYQELYSRDKAEAIIIWGLLKNMSYGEILDKLGDNGLADIFKNN